jgi:hypothetical protein
MVTSTSVPHQAARSTRGAPSRLDSSHRRSSDCPSSRYGTTPRRCDPQNGPSCRHTGSIGHQRRLCLLIRVAKAGTLMIPKAPLGLSPERGFLGQGLSGRVNYQQRRFLTIARRHRPSPTAPVPPELVIPLPVGTIPRANGQHRRRGQALGLHPEVLVRIVEPAICHETVLSSAAWMMCGEELSRPSEESFLDEDPRQD